MLSNGGVFPGCAFPGEISLGESMDAWPLVVSKIHHSAVKCVLVVTGGGASAISDLLVVPGGSRTILEAAVPYSAAALTDWLGHAPEQFCSEETALAMAQVAFERGTRFADGERSLSRTSPPPAGHEPSAAPSGDPRVVGLAATAALASDRPKRGEHRCHAALQTIDATASVTIRLNKGARDRAGEESLVGKLLLRLLASAAAIAETPALDLLPGETLVEQRVAADPLLRELREGGRSVVWSRPDGALVPSLESSTTGTRRPPGLPAARGVLCGAFNPLHFGHEQLRDAAERQLAGPVYFELSLRNVDKRPLDDLTIARRRGQFTRFPLALTSAPTFAEKADALPGVTFVVGVDTALRIVHPRYYGDSEQALRQALAHIRDRGCRFLVAGRQIANRFETLADVGIPAGFSGLFDEIPPDAFRADISSTDLRHSGAEHSAADGSAADGSADR
jgi:hypothetical protein